MYDIKKRESLLERLRTADDRDFSVLFWRDPKKARPREACYVIVKYQDGCGGSESCAAAYEHGRFMFTDSPGIIDEDIIQGWAYWPYNET